MRLLSRSDALRLGTLAIAWLVCSGGQALAEVTVHVRGESPLVAAVAAWRPSDQVLVVFPDGSDRLLAEHKVIKIMDQAGVDRTRKVIYGRGFVGDYPEAYQGSRKAKSAGFNPLIVVACAGVLAVGVLIVVVATQEAPVMF